MVLKGLKCLRKGASRKRNLMEIIYSLTISKVLSGIGLVAKLEQCVRYKIRQTPLPTYKEIDTHVITDSRSLTTE